MGIRRVVASVDVYNPLTGDPVCIDHGYSIYDIIEKSHKRAVFDFGSLGKPKLEVKEGIGLTMRPKPAFKDTRKADFNLTPATSWDEWRPTTGGVRVYRIRHFSAALDEFFSAYTKTEFPENSDLAFELIPQDVPSGWDIEGFEPFYRIVLGGGTWGIYISRNGTNYLQRNVEGSWQSVSELPSIPRGSGLADQDATWVFLKFERGQVHVSFDFGHSYEPFGNPDITGPVVIPAGYAGIEGQGGVVSLGIHQLDYESTGNYYSAPRDALEPFITTPNIVGEYQAPYGSSVNFSDISTDGGRTVQYGVTMTPGSRTAYPWPVKSAPTVQAVQFRYPTQRNVTIPVVTNPWDTWLKAPGASIDIDKPPNLDGGTCTIRLNKEAWSAVQGLGVWRKIRVRLGYLMDDGTTDWYVAFTGYCRDPLLEWNRSMTRQFVTIVADNATIRFKRAKWTPRDVVRLGGMVPNAAADYILKTEGLMDELGIDASYRSWTTFNNTGIRPLERGLGENPGHLIKVDHTKWSTFEDIWEPYQVEMGADDYGVYFTLPKGYVSPTINKVLRAHVGTGVPAYGGDIRELVDAEGGMVSRLDSSDRCTAVMIIGELPDGSQGVAWSRDVGAETNATATNACPWREVFQEIREGVHSPWELMNRNIGVSQERYRLKWYADGEAPVDLTIGRKNRVALYGFSGLEIPDGQQYNVAALRHSYRADDAWNELHTIYGLERVPNV